MKLKLKSLISGKQPDAIFQKGRAGSVLLLTLLLVSLLLVIVLSFVVFVRLELREMVLRQQRMQARANAHLGVNMALARLQGLLGPDDRITAPAGLLDSTPDTGMTDGLTYPNLTGVWTARSETLADTPDYDAAKPFLQWLVSTSDETALKQLDFPRQGSLPDSVLLLETPVRTGEDLSNAEVHAGKRQVERGGYAWWVGDENMKARINLEDKLAETPGAEAGELLASSATAGVHGIRALEGFETFPSNSGQTNRLITRDLLALVVPPGSVEPGTFFHHLTPYSESVLADITQGALRKDLSLYLERKDIDWLEEWGTGIPAGPLGPNKDIALSPPPDYDVLSWKFLHHWYNMHRRQIANKTNLPLDHLQNEDPLDPVSNPKWNSGVMRIEPDMVRLQIILSYHVVKTSTPVDPDAEATWDLYLDIYPLASIWNPYNVGLDNVRINSWIHTFPLEHTFYKNGTKIELTGEGTRDGMWAWKTSSVLQLRWGDQTGNINLGPGEAKIYHSENTGEGLVTHMKEGGGTWLPVVRNAGIYRKIATISGLSGDRISIETKGESWETSGSSWSQLQTTFGFRVEPRSIHRGHPADMKDQMFSGQVAWRREQGNPVSTFVSKNNPSSETLGNLNITPSLFLHLDVGLKTLDEKQLPNKTWLHNIPSLPFAAATSTAKHKNLGVGDATTFYAHPYNVTFEQVNSIEGLLQNQPYFGTSHKASGLTEIVGQEIPMAPLTSLAQLQNLPLYPIESLNWNNYYFQNFAIGNSYALPGLLPGEVKRNSFPFYLGQYLPWQGGDISGKLYSDQKDFNNADYVIEVAPAAVIDRSYAANHLLFDSYFFSSMAAQEGIIFSEYGTERSLREVVEEFYRGESPLPNNAYQAYYPGGLNENTLINNLVPSSGNVENDAYLKAASYLMAAGGFNINSTSVPAWTAMLASSNLKRPVIIEDGEPTPQDKAQFAVSRFTMPIGPAASNDTTREAETRRWQGYRELTEEEIRQLAEAMVKQVKKRGPFRSLGEFVNRRRTSDPDLAMYGALQAALEDPDVDINKNYRDDVLTHDDVKEADYLFEEAATGSRYQGSPAYISQADFLNNLAPVIQARSDTFLIRGYGESSAPRGASTRARAYCEAVVQRVPEYIQSVDSPEEPKPTLTSNINKTYGRKFIVKSFRWIQPSEIYAGP